MLTYPSDPLPQIVFPMDEDAIHPNSFCSAPPHHEPPPLLLPLSSTTPSGVNDGTSRHRRSGRIQAQTPKKQINTDSKAAQKPSRQNQLSPKRQRDAGTMVQVSHSEQPRVESTHGNEKQNKEGCDFSFAAEWQNKQEDQSSQNKPNVSAAENIVQQFADNTAHNFDVTKFPMDSSGGLVVGHSVDSTSVPKGWMIGPLFQSFRSKMASFTEIVMSPVKLFRSNSPPLSMDHPDSFSECELQAGGTSDVELSEPRDMFYPVAQSKNRDKVASEEVGAQNLKTVKYSKKLSFDGDVEMSSHRSEPADERAMTLKESSSPDSVPLQHSSLPCFLSEDVTDTVGSSVLLQSSVNVSASHESKLKTSRFMEDQKGKLAARPKPLPRKCTGNKRKKTSKTLASEVQRDPEVNDEPVSHFDLVKSNKADSDHETTPSLTSSGSHSVSDTDRPHLDGDDDERKIENCKLVRPNLRNCFNEVVKGRKVKPTLDAQQLEAQLNSETSSAAGLGRAKRERKLDCYSQDFLKRKRLTEDKCTKDTNKQDSLNVASDGGIVTGLRSPRKDVVLPDTDVDAEETLKPARKRPAVLTRANKKAKGAKQILAAVNEAVLDTQTKSSSEVMLVCSLDKNSDEPENNQNGNSSKQPSGSRRRGKTRTDLGKSDGRVDNNMDLETTVAITQPKQEPLSEVFVCPDVKQLQSMSRFRNTNKQTLKRKSPNQVSSATESDSTSFSTSSSTLSVELLDLTPTDFNNSQRGQEEERRKVEPNQPSKRPKKTQKRSAVKSSASGGNEEMKQCVPNLHLITKENQSDEGTDKMTLDPIYFEMTPFESQTVPPLSQPHLDCYVQLDKMDEKQINTASVVDEVFPADAEASVHRSINVSRLRSTARGINMRPRRADKQRRRCRVLQSRTRQGAEVPNSITMDDADLATHSSQSSSSRSLLRSYSCPEIPSLRHHDTPWTTFLHSPHHSKIHTPAQHHSSHSPFVHHTHKSLRRARRHTVCSLEVEREIAPLCLRKEVYPSRRSVPYDSSTQHLSPSLALSPTTSLTALASCFLSSPLAFLSKKVESRAAASPSTSSHVSSPTTPSSIYPLSPSTWRLPGLLQRTDSSSATLDSSISGNPLQCEIERRQQSEEEDDGEDTSSSSHEFEDVVMREEKSLSDSEIKVVQKLEERGKVSSIRIRKTLPKPQNNLTPMGLPKPIR